MPVSSLPTGSPPTNLRGMEAVAARVVLSDLKCCTTKLSLLLLRLL